MEIRTCAVVSDDQHFREALEVYLPLHGFAPLFFLDDQGFRSAFGGGYPNPYGEPALHPAPLARGRPEIVVVDVGAKEAAKPKLVKQILQAEPTEELLVVLSERAWPRVEHLTRWGAGNMVLKTGALQDPSRLCRIVNALGERNVQRRQQLLKGRVGLASPDVGGLDMRKPVFLSHSGQDELLAYGVRRYLELHGARVWYSYTDGKGSSWRAKMLTALDRATVLLPLLTSSWEASWYCRSELNCFLEKTKGKGGHVLAIPVENAQAAALPRELAEHVLPDSADAPLPERLNAVIEAIGRLLDLAIEPSALHLAGQVMADA